MKKHRGLTLRTSIILHSVQQISAFFGVFCLCLLLCFSQIMMSVGNSTYTMYQSFTDRADEFEDTDVFSEMMQLSIYDLVRYCVGRSQMERDGTFDGSKVIDIVAFSKRKKVSSHSADVTNNGVYLEVEKPEIPKDGEKEGATSETVSVRLPDESTRYALGDLLKWKQYGIEYEVVSFPLDYLVPILYGDAFYGETTLIDDYLGEEREAKIEEIYNASYEWPNSSEIMGTEFVLDQEYEEDSLLEIIQSRVTMAEKEGVLYSDLYYVLMENAFLENPELESYLYQYNGQNMIYLIFLEERFLPESGITQLEQATSYKGYMTKIAQIEQAVEDISYNYNEYQKLAQCYGEGATNLVYCFQMNMMGESMEISNFPEDVSEEERTAYMKEHYGKYVTFSLEEMVADTNMENIDAMDLYQIFSGYEYAFPEDGRIWIAMDTSYPVVDTYAKAAFNYSIFHPLFPYVLAVGILLLLVWISCFFVLSIFCGYRKITGAEGAEFRLSFVDSVPTEILFAAGAFLTVAVGLLLSGVFRIISHSDYELMYSYASENGVSDSVIIAAAVTLISMIFCLFWYSLLRRGKAHIFWKNSILRRVLDSAPCRGIKRAILHMIDHSSVGLRVFVVYGGIAVCNFILGFALCYMFFRGNPAQMFVVMVLALMVDVTLIVLAFSEKAKRADIIEGITRIREGEVTHQVETDGLHGENLQLAEAVNSIGEGIKTAVETSMKDERLKADLITNVSHDIKTPLTSIINYVDLLKREKIETQPVKGYIEVLDTKSQRLKHLTDDLVEASKISSGNIILVMEKIDLKELLNQSIGEFVEKFEEKGLVVVEDFPKDVFYIEADSRRIWRVVENLFGNVYKYAMPNTRVYLDLKMETGDRVSLSVKNISTQPLNISADELTERFIRGDVSRSTEGSGLGLSIAKNLTELQNGKFAIYLDGDLFKVTLTFPLLKGDATDDPEFMQI